VGLFVVVWRLKRVVLLQACGVAASVWCCCKRVVLLQACGAAASVWCCCKRVVLLQSCGVAASLWCCCVAASVWCCRSPSLSGVDYEGIMRSMRSTGYQATNLGLAVEEVVVAVMLVFDG